MAKCWVNFLGWSLPKYSGFSKVIKRVKSIYSFGSENNVKIFRPKLKRCYLCAIPIHVILKNFLILIPRWMYSSKAHLENGKFVRQILQLGRPVYPGQWQRAKWLLVFVTIFKSSNFDFNFSSFWYWFSVVSVLILVSSIFQWVLLILISVWFHIRDVCSATDSFQCIVADLKRQE